MANRITICFASGELMFEGESTLANEAVNDDDIEECPPTMRSAAVSGVFRAIAQGQKKDSDRVA